MVSFIEYTKTDDIFKSIAEGVETKFEASSYQLDRLLPKEKNKKVIKSIKDELGGKIIAKIVGLKPKTYSYLIDDEYNSEDKNAKDRKMCVIKRKLKFENCKNCLEVTKLENKISYLEKNKISIDSLKKIIKNYKKQ